MFVLGNIENLRRNCVAIVGSRDCTKYGKDISKSIAFNLAKANNVIVSGLAKGVDSFAHIGALEAKGKTIAVLGHGLDRIYPKQNYVLAKRIIYEGGTIVTEYESNSKINKENFIKRNRIISGLSRSVIIVEAKQKSGALITANFALNQGRDIFAVPRKY